MKFFATLVLSALAVASAQVPACDSTKLVSVAAGADGKACTAATGYSAATLSIPVGEVLAKVCADASCTKLLAAITAAVPTECTFGGVQVKAALIDKFPAACQAVLKSAGGAGAANTTTMAPGATTMAPAATTMAPAATTMAPEATTMAPEATAESSGSKDMEEVEVTMSSGSGEAEDSAKTPADASTVPTPAPSATSSASTIAAATSTVLVAAAASLL